MTDFSETRRGRGRALGSGGAEPAAQPANLNTAQSIARVLRAQIHSGKLAPSTRVTQRDLAAQFGHSPMPARDAVKILLSEGLVVQEGSKTIVVAPITLADFDEMPNQVQDKSPSRLMGLAHPPTFEYEPDPMAKRETLELVRAYYKIPDQAVRKRITDLARALARSA